MSHYRFFVLIIISMFLSVGQAANRHKTPDHKKYRTAREVEMATIGTPVTTSPYMGIRPEFSGGDLIVNVTKINQDLALLKREKMAEDLLESRGLVFPQSPIIMLSGKIEGYTQIEQPYTGRYSSEIDLLGSELDVVGRIHHWATTYVSFEYDRSAPATGNVSRVRNSRVTLAKGFLTLGDLNHSPYYMSVGQMFVPFGLYNSGLFSDSLNKLIGRTKARALLLGYQEPHDKPLMGQVYIFQGDTVRDMKATHVNEWGANVGNLFKVAPAVETQVNFGYISNIADSGGMQSTGGAEFGGFGMNATAEVLAHRVGGYDVFVRNYYQNMSLSVDYTAGASGFETADMTMNQHKARPRAYHIEGDYDFEWLDKPSTIALGYGGSFDALALNVPKRRIAITWSMSWLKDTIQSLEYRTDRNYRSTESASGSEIAIADGGNFGQSSHTISLMAGVYF